MSEAIIREIAQQIINEQLLQNWKCYLLLILLIIACSFIASFVTSYSRKRGENFATKTDFDDLVKQLKATTKIAEEVKVAVNHSDWTLREWKTIRRIKLEELVNSIYEAKYWFEKDLSLRMYEGEEHTDSSPFYKVTTIAALYFPELAIEVNDLMLIFSEFTLQILDHQKKASFARKNSDMDAYANCMDGYVSDYEIFYPKLVNVISEIENKVPVLMKAIVGV